MNSNVISPKSRKFQLIAGLLSLLTLSAVVIWVLGAAQKPKYVIIVGNYLGTDKEFEDDAHARTERVKAALERKELSSLKAVEEMTWFGSTLVVGPVRKSVELNKKISLEHFSGTYLSLLAELRRQGVKTQYSNIGVVGGMMDIDESTVLVIPSFEGRVIELFVASIPKSYTQVALVLSHSLHGKSLSLQCNGQPNTRWLQSLQSSR